MQQPRIAMAINTMGLGGVPEVVLHLMQQLSGRGFERHLYVMKESAEPNPSRDARRDAFEALGVEVTVAPAEGGKLDSIAALAAWLGERRIDILHTHSYRPNVYARMAGTMLRPMGLKLVAHYHNQYDDKWTRSPPMLELERRLACSTDAFVSVSESVREHVAERVGIDTQQIEVIANGVDGARFRSGDREAARHALGIEPGRIAIGSIGRICEQKGQEDLIDAVALLAGGDNPPLFLLAGDIEDHRLYERLCRTIAKRGLGHMIRFLGHHDDMPGLYAALDMVVAPSRWEGFGLMLVEAMSAGLPIVASRGGAIAEIVKNGECALLVPPRDANALAAAVRRLIADDTLRTRLAEAADRRHHAFCWSAAGTRLADLYERMIYGPAVRAAWA